MTTTTTTFSGVNAVPASVELRDYFAAQSLVLLVGSNPVVPCGVAERAYILADALLAARQKGGSK